MNALISSVEEVTMLFEGAFQALGGNSSLRGIPAFKETMSRKGKSSEPPLRLVNLPSNHWLLSREKI